MTSMTSASGLGNVWNYSVSIDQIAFAPRQQDALEDTGLARVSPGATERL
jgi:hypothetical protein